MSQANKTKPAQDMRQSDSSKLLAVRSIKFRAWNTINKVMLPKYGVLAKIEFSQENKPNRIGIYEWKLINDNGDGDWDGFEIEGESNFVLMQFTGLYDCNGKEIYEGDIYTIEGGVYVVVFAVEESAFMRRVIDPAPVSAEVKDELLYMPGNGEGRILGNIFEHPYLLLEERDKHS